MRSLAIEASDPDLSYTARVRCSLLEEEVRMLHSGVSISVMLQRTGSELEDPSQDVGSVHTCGIYDQRFDSFKDPRCCLNERVNSRRSRIMISHCLLLVAWTSLEQTGMAAQTTGELQHLLHGIIYVPNIFVFS